MSYYRAYYISEYDDILFIREFFVHRRNLIFHSTYNSDFVIIYDHLANFEIEVKQNTT